MSERNPIHRKVTVGAGLGALFATTLWLAKVLGHPIEITAEEALYVNTALVFIAQWWTRNQRGAK